MATVVPTGTVTFLFTDIEGSTRLWQEHPRTMPAALARHDHLIRTAVVAHSGHVFKTVGDSFCAAFAVAADAVAAAVALQRALQAEPWGETGAIRVRVALHSGLAESRDGDYFGQPLNRVARLLMAGHGGQILLSGATLGLVRDALPAGVSLRDLGERRLRDLAQPEHVTQLLAPGLPSTFPPLRTLDSRPNNLPTQPTPLIGREREVEQLRRLLLDRNVSLVTLVGPGGSGKTRLAVHVAAEVLDAFADGVYVVPLAAVPAPELVAPAIAAAVGLRTAPGIQDGGGASVADALLAYLAERSVLLVLDNFEHVIAAAPFLAELLAGVPGLRSLVTSRAILRLPGEREFPVPALAVPDAGQTAPARLARSPSVALFVDRAVAVKPDFRLTADNAAAVAEICRRLDGLPLAIELAAARVKLLPPPAMLARLRSRLTLLTGGARDLPERQQTLRGAIVWSYDLLDPPERDLFARLAVFAGGAATEAIEAVVAGPEPLPTAGDGAARGAGPALADRLASLVDKSLLRQTRSVAVDPAGGDAATEARYTMLETVREFALDRLASTGEADAVRRRHATYFAALVARSEAQLRGLHRRAWLARLEADHDNLRAALAWCAEHPDDRALGLQLAAALWRFWFGAGHWREGLLHLNRAIAGAPDAPPALRAKALVGAGHLARLAGYYDDAKSHFEEVLPLTRELGNAGAEGFALGGLGIVAHARGDYDTAEARLSEALAAVRRTADGATVALALYWLGNVARGRGDLLPAVERYEEALRLFRSVGDQAGIAWSLAGLGIAAEALGNHAAAGARLHEALALSRLSGDRAAIATSLTYLGIVAHHQGEPARAAAYFGEALHLARELGDRATLANALGYTGVVAVGRGHLEAAARLLGAADAIREEAGVRVRPERAAEFDRAVATLRVQLPAPRFDDAWLAGRTLTESNAAAEAHQVVAGLVTRGA